MQIIDSASFIHYFDQCACDSKHIKEFFHGNSDRILNAQRSKTDYPIFWLEHPDISLIEKCGLQIKFDSAFTILFNSEKDDWQKNDYNLQCAFNIAMEFVKKMNEDACERSFFDFDINRVNIDLVHTLTHDNEWGWRVNFSIVTAAAHCVNECAWLGTCPAGAMARFKWNNTIKGTFEGLEIENLSTPENHAWTYEWSYSIDASTPITSTDETLNVEGGGRFIYVSLKLTDENGCVQCASAVFNNCLDCGYSVPYNHKPKGY